MKQAFSRLSIICLSTLSYLCATGKISLAQVVPDNTVNTQVNQNGGVAEITGGETRGSNLFHSFQDFSVPTGNEAFFDNADNISNIFSRVTGGSVSNIDGAIRANGSASLFLINPAGIVFGENASLNIGGSFFGSTASSILFPEGEFSAIAPESESVLTVDVPIGLGFGDNPGDISNSSTANDGRGLEVSVGKDITLAGGNVNLSGGKIFAPGGKVELGGLSVADEIEINFDSSLSFPEEIARANVNLTNAAEVNVEAEGGGSIVVNAGNIQLSGNELGGSVLSAGIATDSNSVEAQAGDIVLNATDNISLKGSGIFSAVESEAIGNAGGIDITTTNLSLTQGGVIQTNIIGQGSAGRTIVNASDTILIEGENKDGSVNSGIFNGVVSTGLGNSSGIDITTTNLSLTEGGLVTSSSAGRGNAGLIAIDASDISAEGERRNGNPSGIVSQINRTAQGDSGGIEIDTTNLSLAKGAVIDSSTSGQGGAGIIIIDASDTISVAGESQAGLESKISSQVTSSGVGNSNGINITTARLSLDQGGTIDASTFGQGNAGAIIIDASDSISIEKAGQNVNSSILSQVTMGGTGNSTGIDITTNNLFLKQGGRISATTFGQGNAGAIKINASDSILIERESQVGIPSGIFTRVGSEGVGDSAGINIATTNFFLKQGGVVSASTFGQGNAGEVKISALDNIELVSRSSFTSIAGALEADEVGDAGGITVNAEDISLTGSAISVQSLGQGNAGNLDIQAQSLALENNSFFVSSTPAGQGGNITLQIADNLALSNNSTISAQAIMDADGGNLSIDARFITATPNQNNNLIASAEQGTGGNINIVSAGVFGLEERSSTPDNNTNDIDASSDLGIDGSVNVNTTNDFLNSFELIIPEFIVAEKALQGSCFARRNSQQGSFVYGGTGGLPANPDSAVDEEPSLSSRLPDIRSNPQVLNPSDVNSADAAIRSAPTAQKWQIGDPIVEPTNLVKTADGRSLWVNQKASRNSSVCQ